MARVKKGVTARKRHKKVIKQAKGFYGQKSRNFKAANPAVMRALRSAYVGRKNRRENTEDCGLQESTLQQEQTASATASS